MTQIENDYKFISKAIKTADNVFQAYCCTTMVSMFEVRYAGHYFGQKLVKEVRDKIAENGKRNIPFSKN